MLYDVWVHECKSVASILVYGVLMYGCMDACASVLISALLQSSYFFCVNDLYISECGFGKKIISLNPKPVTTCIHISAAFQDASAAKYLAMLASLPVRTRGSIHKNNLNKE